MERDHSVEWSRIDPVGPVDPLADPQPVDEVDRPAASTLMAPGWWPPEHLVTQACGFCFTPDGRVVLVQAHALRRLSRRWSCL
jgi:hypothetical protein